MAEQGVSDDTDADAAFDQAASAPEAASAAPEPDSDEDPWAAAMAEQQAAEEQTEAADTASETESAPEAKEASSEVFPPLSGDQAVGTSRDLEMIMDIPVKLTVELGRTKLTIKQLLELAQGSVVELEGLAGEPMDILINGYLIAQGEVVVIEDKYGIRITEIITPSERIHKLNR
nr:flagellar motor switch protein FliN [Halomonas jeotgali]